MAAIDIFYLALVLVAFTGFAAVLAYFHQRERPPEEAGAAEESGVISSVPDCAWVRRTVLDGLQTRSQFSGACIEITRSDIRPVTPLGRILHSVTCRMIKMLELSDDIYRKLDVVMTNRGKSTTKLLVDCAQGDKVCCCAFARLRRLSRSAMRRWIAFAPAIATRCTVSSVSPS
jgi:hypothetical protein